MKRMAPGRYDRDGISLVELFRMFPDNAAAEKWFEAQRWPNGIACPDCGSLRYTSAASRKPMPYRCKDCRHHFSVRKGTVMQSSKLGYQTWVVAIYLVATSLKGVSSMKLHRDLKVRQSTAWYLAQRIRKGFTDGSVKMLGPVETDETFIGGREKNKHANRKLRAGRGAVGKTAVAGVKDRSTNRVSAAVVPTTDKDTLQSFVSHRVASGATIYTDEHAAYRGLANHESVKHSVGEFVNDQAHTNGIESFWSLLKRGYYGTYHKMSEKHLQRYVDEFSGRHNIRSLDTIDQMSAIVRGMDGKKLRYLDLIA